MAICRDCAAHCLLLTTHWLTHDTHNNLHHRRRYSAGDFLSDCQARHSLGNALEHNRHNPDCVDWHRRLLVVGQPARFAVIAVEPSTPGTG